MSAAVTTRQLSAEETAALDEKLGPPKGARPKNEKEKASTAKRAAEAAKTNGDPKSAPESKPPKTPKLTPEQARAKLQETADAIARATRLKDASAVITSKSGNEARIMFEERSLAFVRVTTKGIRVHVQHWGREDRLSAETVAEAAKLVKQSERRKPKAPPAAKAS